MIKKTFTVVIPALNEEKNISQLLNDIYTQNYSDSFNQEFLLKNILVISDNSTDSTDKLVRNSAKIDNSILLIRNEKRLGKALSLERGFQITNTDYVILFDADVRAEKDTIQNLLKPLTSKTYDLIGGNPIPVTSRFILNVSASASYFSWLLAQEVKNQNPNTIYSAHGRVLCLSKSLYKRLDMKALHTPGDDQYFYLNSENSFLYVKNAVVFFKLPQSIGDYLKQSTRFRKSKQIKNFSHLNTKRKFEIENKFRILLITIIKSPISGFCWIILYALGYLKFNLGIASSNELGAVWSEVKSTK